MVSKSAILMAVLALVPLATGCAVVPYRVVRVVEETKEVHVVDEEPGETSPAEPTPERADRLVSLEARLDALADRDAEQARQIGELQQQVAHLQQQLMGLTAQLDRLEKMTIARYERYLEEDRKVLQQLDTALSMWIQSMQQAQPEPQQPSSPGSTPTQPRQEQPAYRSARGDEQAPTTARPSDSSGQLIILR